MATVTSLTASPYTTGHLPAGETLEFAVTLDNADDDLGIIDPNEVDYFFTQRLGFVPVVFVQSVSVQRIDSLNYRLSYNSYNSEYRFTIITGGRSGNRQSFSFRISPPPPPVNISVRDHFIKNGDTVRIYFKMIRKQFLTISDITVNAGILSNWVANDSTYEYSIDLTAPDTGAGGIRLSTPFANAYEDFLYAPAPTEDIIVASRLKPTHLADPETDTLYMREVTADDLDDINDFEVLVSFSRNVTGFSKEKIMLNAIDDANDPQTVSLQKFEGEHSVYSLVVRPPMVGGTGTMSITVPENVTNEGNSQKTLIINYTDQIIVPEWSKVFKTTDAYKDIVSVDRQCVQMLRDVQIDCFNLEGSIDADKQVDFPDDPTIRRAIQYDIGKYIGLSDDANTTAHLFIEGIKEWTSGGVFRLDTYNAFDWVWTRDRRIIIVATQPTGPVLGVLPAREVHEAIRSGYDLNDAVFDGLSLSNDLEAIENWGESVVIAHGEGNHLFVASNETGADVQNYVSVYDAENQLLPEARIPISGRTTALFVFDGWLYRYDDTNMTLYRFSLDVLRLPTPKAEIYPFILLPGDEIPLLKLIKHATQVVFDVGFEKPDWLSIEDNVLKVAEDAIPKSTAYARLRGINRNGASLFGTCGFYVYVREPQTPIWKAFESLSMYDDNHELDMFAFVDGADTIELQHGFTPPSNIALENGKVKVK